MQQVIDRVVDVMADLGVRALAFVAFALAVFIAYRLLRATADRVVRRAAVDLPPELAVADDERSVRMAERRRRFETVAAFGLRLLRWTAYAAVLLVAIATFTPGLWDALGGLGVVFGVAVGGAIGFGAQQLVRDYLNGMLILGENPYSVGDVVEVAGVRGTVEDVGLRRTVVRDIEGTVHSVPNGAIIVASNFTRTFARVNEKISVAFGTDIDLATRLINDAGRALAADEAWDARILVAPAVVRVETVADSGIPILVQGTVRPGDQWAVAGELRRRILEAFGGAGIELATSRQFILDGRGRGPAADPGAATDESDVEFT